MLIAWEVAVITPVILTGLKLQRVPAAHSYESTRGPSPMPPSTFPLKMDLKS